MREGCRVSKMFCCSAVRAGQGLETPLAKRERYTGQQCPDCPECLSRRITVVLNDYPKMSEWRQLAEFSVGLFRRNWLMRRFWQNRPTLMKHLGGVQNVQEGCPKWEKREVRRQESGDRMGQKTVKDILQYGCPKCAGRVSKMLFENLIKAETPEFTASRRRVPIPFRCRSSCRCMRHSNTGNSSSADRRASSSAPPERNLIWQNILHWNCKD